MPMTERGEEETWAVILAAGEGQRLRPLTRSRPKGMIPVGNRPILEHVLSALRGAGVRRAVLVVGYHKESIMTYFGDGSAFGLDLRYVEQAHPIGTAHAMVQAAGTVPKDRPFLCLPGDNVVEAGAVAALLARRGEDRAVALATESDTPSKYGVLFIRGERITKLIEKPPATLRSEYLTNRIATGIYLFPPWVMDRAQELVRLGQNNLSDLVHDLLSREPGMGWIETDLWADAVYPWDLIAMNALVIPASGAVRDGRVEEGVVLRGAVRIGPGSVVRAGSYIEGPAAIGSGCSIGPYAVIHPSTAIGDNVSVGPFTHIRNTLVMSDSQIGSHVVLDNAVLGPGCTVGPGVVGSRGPARVCVGGELHELADTGPVVGDDSCLGQGAVVAPGSVVGCGAQIGPGARVSGTIPDGAYVL